jgi:hypothetical protein
MSRNLGALTLLDPSGPAWPVMGVLLQAIKAHMGSTLSLTLVLDEVHGKCRAPPILPTREAAST